MLGRWSGAVVGAVRVRAGGDGGVEGGVEAVSGGGVKVVAGGVEGARVAAGRRVRRP